MAVSDFTIRQLGLQGDGITQGSQGWVYVDRALPGDRIKARVRKDEAGVNRAEIIKILEPSPYRQVSPCAHYERCGGCTLQHLESDFYQSWKIQIVREALNKVGLRPRQWHPAVFIGPYNRRRATFSASKKAGQVVMGYYRRRSQQIADIDLCLVADPRIIELRQQIKPYLESILADGETVDVFLQYIDGGFDVTFTGSGGRKAAQFSQLLKSARVRRLSWRANEQQTPRTVTQSGGVTAKFGELEVQLPALAFLQPTKAGEQALVQAVAAALPTSVKKVADLFSGCGTFTGPLLKQAAVDAYESDLSAVKALAKAGSQKLLKVYRRDLFLNPLRREEVNRYDAIIFDPPRAGCREQALAMASARTPILVGVSCNPATFARDARILCQGGYRLQSIQIVDQFLWSHHVEVVGVFQR